MKKILSILLLLCLVVCTLTACNGGGESTETGKSESSKAESTDTSEEEYRSPGEEIAYADLEKKDLGNREIFITERWFGYGKNTIDFSGEVLYMEDDNGSLTNVNQAKKDIIEQIQKDYNCKITGEIFGEGSTNIVGDLKSLITTDITAGTGKYDFFFESYYYYTSFIADGQLLNIKELKTINLDSSCWDQNAVSELSVCDALYFILGDINTYDNDGTVTLLFNKKLYETLGYTEDLYKLVKNHEWTFDKLVELSTSFVNLDDNQDGERNELDNWFMGSEESNLYMHCVAAGESICSKDKNDVPQLTMSTEQTINALTDAVEFYLGGKVLVATLPEYREKYPAPGECYEKTVTNSFLEGRELFYMTTLIHIPYFRQMNDEFGILPVPMYSDSQDDYCSAMSVHTSSVLMIPNTQKADDDLGTVIQALAELSEEKLTPEYYDKQLKFRDFKDEESSEMLDIIFDNRHYDLGAVFGQSWNNVDTLYQPLDTNIKSRFEEKETLIKNLIESTIDDIKDSLNAAE
jgi:ABC-type glycerol-3-phosphate transport system substrate-binding protein